MSSGKYVPPHMRNKKVEEPPAPAPSPAPASEPSSTPWGEKKTFAQLAKEWDEKMKLDELEKKQIEKEEEDHRMYRRVNMPLPHFHNVHRFVEPEDDEFPPEEEAPKPEPTGEDEWITVDRKVRRKKTMEERLARPPTPEENTVWNNDAPEEHETCWNDRY